MADKTTYILIYGELTRDDALEKFKGVGLRAHLYCSDEGMIAERLVHEIEELGYVVTYTPGFGLGTWPKDRPLPPDLKAATPDQYNDVAALLSLVDEIECGLAAGWRPSWRSP
jgi:hypothetical protein